MHRIIYGTDTGSIEDFDQCVAMYIRDDMDAEELEQAIREDPLQFETEEIVTEQDAIDAFDLAMQGEGIDRAVIDRIITTVADAIANND